MTATKEIAPQPIRTLEWPKTMEAVVRIEYNERDAKEVKGRLSSLLDDKYGRITLVSAKEL